MNDHEEYKQFYDTQYDGDAYANTVKMEEHPFYPELKQCIDKYGITKQQCLEVGSGRGALQDVVVNYTGVDYADTVRKNYHKPFVCASAEKLPLRSNSFDFIWSYAVLEHIPGIEQALEEMIRVAKDGGILVLHPAWHCRKWAANGYQVRPYTDFNILGKIYKMMIPVLNLKIVRMIPLAIRRLSTYIVYHKKSYIKLSYKKLKPNYQTFWQSDSDACNDLDQFMMILWFESRGHSCLSHPNTIRALLASHERIEIRVNKSASKE